MISGRNCVVNVYVLQLGWYSSGFNSLQNSKILDVTKLKAFADDKLNVVKMMICFFDSVENCGKGRKCWLFSPFPKVFSKAFFRVVKSWECVGKS